MEAQWVKVYSSKTHRDTFYISLLISNISLFQKIFERGSKRGLDISLISMLYKERSTVEKH